MTVKEFDEFVKRQQEAAQVDWDRERGEWLAHLDELYSKIESMLSVYTSSSQISVRYITIDLNEENLGSYRAREMILRIGRQEVDLVPAGTRFVGFKGLVDVSGSAGKASLALANKDRHLTVQGPVTTELYKKVRQHRSGSELVASPDKIEWVWKILPRPPGRSLDELTSESFFQLLMEVTNG